VPTIKFEPTAPSAQITFPLDGEPPKRARSGYRRVSWSVRVGNRSSARNEIRLATGGKLNDIKGVVGVCVGTATPDGKIDYGDDLPARWGGLHYYAYFKSDFEAYPENYLIELGVSAALFDRLVHFAELGRPPIIGLELGDGFVFGKTGAAIKKAPIKFGWEPDGSALEWDNKESPNVEITWCSFEVECGAPEPEDEDVPDREINLSLPPTRKDVLMISTAMEKAGGQLNRLANSVLWFGWFFIIAIVANHWFH
jgi:hypothetical protein